MNEVDLVFGKFGGWRNIKMDAFLIEAGKVRDSLIEFDHALLVAYISFILARKGYVLEIPKFDSSVFFDSEAWVEAILELKDRFVFPWSDIVAVIPDKESPSPGYIILRNPSHILHIYISFPYNSYFEDYEANAREITEREIERFRDLPKPILQEPEGKEKIIEKLLSKQYDYRPRDGTGVFIPDEDSREKIENVKKTIQQYVKDDRYTPSLTFIDPRLIEKDGAKYREIKNALKQKYGWDLLKSPDDLLEEFAEKKDREKLKREWVEIRNKAIEKIKEDIPLIKPFIIWALNPVKFEEIEKKLRINFPRMIKEGKLRETIGEIGRLCEALFSLIYEKEYLKKA